MPRPARSGSSTKGKGPASAPAPTPPVAVRMLSGPRAGQTVAVSAEEAARLCSGWTPQAELVARNAASLRETR